MGKCINHPDRETSYQCLKHNFFLCNECLECKDPDLYCKFRSACPIHFISKKGFDKKEKSANGDMTILFEPDHVNVHVSVGTNLMEAARKADIYVNASCNGKEKKRPGK